MFCTKCGHKLRDEAKFCESCGTPTVDRGSKMGRTTYEGAIHKCSVCGETLKSFEIVCPACGAELRDVKSSSTLKEFAEKLERADSDVQRIIIIKNHPIPNTKEDIFEFMVLASTNFDAVYYATHLHEDDVSDAWLIKIEQCYAKARLAFGSDPDFDKIESIYNKIKRECAEQEGRVNLEEKAKREACEGAEKENAFKKSKLRTTIIVFAIISALFIAVAFNDGRMVAGIIAVVMLILLVIAFLMGSNVIKEKTRNMRLIPFILALVLIIPYFSTYDSSSIVYGSTRWGDIILNEYAPKPKMTSAKVMTNSRDGFYIYNIKCSRNYYYDYVADCKEFGYDYEIIEEDEYSFEAYNAKGYLLKISYITTLSIELIAPMKRAATEWPNSSIAKLASRPESIVLSKKCNKSDICFWRAMLIGIT